MNMHLLSYHKRNSADLNYEDLVWKSLNQWFNSRKFLEIPISSQYKKFHIFPEYHDTKVTKGVRDL